MVYSKIFEWAKFQARKLFFTLFFNDGSYLLIVDSTCKDLWNIEYIDSKESIKYTQVNWLEEDSCNSVILPRKENKILHATTGSNDVTLQVNTLLMGNYKLNNEDNVKHFGWDTLYVMDLTGELTTYSFL